MKLGLIVLVVGIVACDAGVTPQQAPPPPPVPVVVSPPPVIKPFSPPAEHPHEVLATLQRTVCYGTCPAYTVTVYRDGVVEFNGVEFVGTKGKATGQIKLAQVDEIEKLFVDNHYLSFSDSYENEEVTDAPSATTSYRSIDGHVKRVGHYQGDSHAPPTLGAIEARLDELLDTQQWIGTRKRHRR